MRRFRDIQSEQFRSLPPLSIGGAAGCEFHMLCGQRDWKMGVLASWSIMRFFPGSILYVHSDGTLQSEPVHEWRRIVGRLEVVPKERRDSVVRQKLSAICPRVYDWRCANWASTQLVDMHFFGNASKFVVLDSDVLCFSDPSEVRLALESADRRFMWGLDTIDAYAAPRERLESYTGMSIPVRLCAGFLVTSRFASSDYSRLESLLARLDSVNDFDLNHYWSCQTYYALMVAGDDGQHGPLPTEYAIYKGRTESRTKVRHYVGVPSIRPRYFTEGIPRLIRQVATTRPDEASET